MRMKWDHVSISENLAGVPGTGKWLSYSQTDWGVDCTRLAQSTVKVILNIPLLYCKLEDSVSCIQALVLRVRLYNVPLKTLPFTCEPSIHPCLRKHLLWSSLPHTDCSGKADATLHPLLIRWLLFKFALDKPFKKKLNADDYNVCTTLKLLICRSNNLGF